MSEILASETVSRKPPYLYPCCYPAEVCRMIPCYSTVPNQHKNTHSVVTLNMSLPFLTCDLVFKQT